MTNLVERAKEALKSSTPGPWVVERPDHHPGMIKVSGPLVAVQGFTIATDVSEQQARTKVHDAALIALAPDMARALIRHDAQLKAAGALAEAAEEAVPFVGYCMDVADIQERLRDAKDAFRQATEDTQP